MNFDEILKNVNNKFMPRKSIDFEDYGIHIELQPLAAKDEIKIIDYCKDYEGTEYMEMLKRSSLALAIKNINGNEIDKEIIEYTDEEGNVKSKSRFLYMIDYLGKWPSSLVDILFDSFANVTEEAEDRAKKGIKFDRYDPPAIAQIAKSKFKKVEEAKEPLTETEQLNEKVSEEIDKAQTKLNTTGV